MAECRCRDYRKHVCRRPTREELLRTALEDIKVLGKTEVNCGLWTDLERKVFEIAHTALRRDAEYGPQRSE